MSIDKGTLEGLRINRRDEAPRRSRGWIIAALGLIAVAVVVYFLVANPGAIEVRAATAMSVAGDTRAAAVLNASGYVTARRAATVSSKVTGKVIEVLVEEGMRVKEGDVLARLDRAISDKGHRLAQAEAEAARSALEETRVRIAQARLDYDRAARLANEKISSTQDVDRARAELNALQARLATQSENYEVARRGVAVRQQDVDDTVIRAPFDGVVVSKDAQPGEMISPISAGSGFTRTGICTIVDMDSLEIEVDVAEAYINRVRAGQKAEAVLDAYPDWKVPAHVITTIPTADRQKATVKVRIGIDAKDVRILPDMGVKVSFLDDAPAGAAPEARIVVPRNALRRDGDQDVVFVIKDDKVERRAVRVANTDGDRMTLGAGVSEGERVVVEPPAELKDGSRVTIADATQ